MADGLTDTEQDFFDAKSGMIISCALRNDIDTRFNSRNSLQLFLVLEIRFQVTILSKLFPRPHSFRW